MIRRHHDRSFPSHLVIILLLFSIVCVSINATGSAGKAHSATVLKKPGTTSCSDTLLPEKVESEDDHKPLLSFLYLNPVDEIFHLNISQALHTCLFNATRIRSNTIGLPIYLVKRSIMI